MLIAGLTLGLGIAAVLIAVVYRFFIMGAATDTPPVGGPPIVGEVTAEAVGLPPAPSSCR